MSANKRATVQFNRREYKRLRELEKTAMFTNPKNQTKHSNAINYQMQDQLRQLELRQDQYQKIMLDMTGEITSIEQEAGEALIQQQQEYMAHLSSIETDLVGEAKQVLEEERTMFQSYINQLQDAHQEQLVILEDEILQLKQSEFEKMQLAQEYMEKIETLTTWINESYRWQKFLPQNLVEIEEEIRLMNRNFDFGNYEVVLSRCLAVEGILSRTRLELEKLENEWGILCETVKQNAIRLNLAAKEKRSINPIDMNGNILPQQRISVNHWTNGQLGEFSRKTKNRYEDILNHNEEYSIAELKEWLETALPALEDELVDLVMTARMNVLDTQLRKNIADVIIKTLSDQGFAVKSIDAKRDEIDHPISVDMENNSGDMVYVYIQPDEEEYARNNISIQTNESQPMMAYELEARRLQIAETLRNKGVSVEVVAEDSMYENNSIYAKNQIMEGNRQRLKIKKKGLRES